MFSDSIRHKGLRRRLVEGLKQKGITDENVLKAIERVPRHLFMESGFINYAYSDKAFPIAAGQTISQPYTVAFQTQLLCIQKGEKVLEIGTGSGFQTAVLLEMGAKVYTVERQIELYAKAQTVLSKMRYKPNFFYGDGYQGLPTYGPFDKILVTAGATYLPQPLLEQLTVGGILVIPIGSPQGQKMKMIVKTGESEFKEEEMGDFKFVPMLKGVQK